MFMFNSFRNEEIIIDLDELNSKEVTKVYYGYEKNRNFYCHLQKSTDDLKHIVLRSPIQIKNNLKRQIQLKLLNDIEFRNNQISFTNDKFAYENSENIISLSEDSTTTIPLKMLNFNWFQINMIEPKINKSITTEIKFPDLDEEEEAVQSRYKWSDPVYIDIQALSQTELFQTKPFTLKCWSSNRQSFQTDGELTPEIYLK